MGGRTRLYPQGQLYGGVGGVGVGGVDGSVGGGVGGGGGVGVGGGGEVLYPQSPAVSSAILINLSPPNNNKWERLPHIYRH